MDLKKAIWIGIGLIIIFFLGVMTVRKVKFNPKMQENLDRWHQQIDK